MRRTAHTSLLNGLQTRMFRSRLVRLQRSVHRSDVADHAERVRVGASTMTAYRDATQRCRPLRRPNASNLLTTVSNRTSETPRQPNNQFYCRSFSKVGPARYLAIDRTWRTGATRLRGNHCVGAGPAA